MNKQEIISKLQELQQQFSKGSNSSKGKESVNLFTAFGLQNAERHHSTFFAGLLDPQNPHEFGELALKRFLYYLWNDTVKEYEINQGQTIIKGNTLSNIEILKSVANNRQELIDLANGKVNVRTEVSTSQLKNGKRGYIDILVEIGDENEDQTTQNEEKEATRSEHKHVKTVIVIENKTGTDTHSDQLRKYEDFIDSQYPDTCKKIFVLLSPFGSVPLNIGGNGLYNNRYCIFSYGEKDQASNQGGVCAIIEDILSAIKNNTISPKQKNKLKYILGDYKEMVEKEILVNDPDIRKSIKNLYDQFPDIVDLIKNYYDNLQELLDYAEQWLSSQPTLKGFKVLSKNKSSLNFTTEKLEQYYSSNNKKMKTDNVYRISTDSDSLVGYFNLSELAKSKRKANSEKLPPLSGTIETWKQRCNHICGTFKDHIDAKLCEFRDRILTFEA